LAIWRDAHGIERALIEFEAFAESMTVMQAPQRAGMHLPRWLAATIAASGGLGLCALSFLDSSFLPFPTLNDFLLINLSARFPLRMPYYALMATLGAMLGGLLLYAIARKGEEAFFRKRAGARAERVHAWVKKNGFLAVAIGALLPPPFPFKIVIFAAGALEMPLGVFISAMLLARLIRFFGEGILAVKYGAAALPFLRAHSVSITVGSLVVAVGFYLAVHFAFRPAKNESA
jgi:membrane protein YqaA with SNARE-associated domain